MAFLCRSGGDPKLEIKRISSYPGDVLVIVPRPDGPQISISNDFSTTLGGMVEEMATISLSSPVRNPPEVRNLAIEEGDFFPYLLLRLFGGCGWYE